MKGGTETLARNLRRYCQHVTRRAKCLPWPDDGEDGWLENSRLARAPISCPAAWPAPIRPTACQYTGAGVQAVAGMPSSPRPSAERGRRGCLAQPGSGHAAAASGATELLRPFRGCVAPDLGICIQAV